MFTLVLGYQSGLWAELNQYLGKPIASIRIEPSGQPLDIDTLRAILPLREGDLLQGATLREAIQRLYATGEYQDVAADATLENGQVALRFVTTFNWFIGSVEVDGVPEPPSTGQLATATKFVLGGEYVERDLKTALEGLTDTLKRNGFYDPHIIPSVVRDPARHQVKIRFLIVPGRRARFDGVKVTGDPGRPIASVAASAGWKPFRGLLPWRTLTENHLQTGVENVRSWYPRNNHLLAKVTLSSLDYHPDTNRVTPVLDIEAGPRIRVKVTGANISGARLRSLLPIYSERSIDKDLLMEGRKNLIGFLQSQGFFEAEADYKQDQTGGDQTIEYIVQRGARHKLALLDIRGNHYFDKPTIRDRMTLLPATRLRFRYGRYSPAYLERDLNAIRDMYRSNGFRGVKVTSQQQDNYRGIMNAMAVFIDIDEGPQSFVSDLVLSGVTETGRAKLLAFIRSTAGQPYSDYNVASDRDSVLEYYYDNGYPNAKFDYTETATAIPGHVALNFRVDPGPREYVRAVIVNGLRNTRPEVVDRRISLAGGDPLAQTGITDSQRRLYDLGIFAKVNTGLQNPEGDEPSKYVIYSLEEAHRYSMTLGVGAEIARIGGGTTSLDAPAGATGFSPRLAVGLSRLNFFGSGHTLSLQTLASTFEQRALLTYFIPQFMGDPKLNLQVAGFFDISKDVRTFSARREEGSVQLGRKLSKSNTVQFRYVFRKVDILGIPLVAHELIPLLSQPVRVGLLGASFIQDRRDDPADAHHGVYNTIDLSLAAKPFGSQTGFGRVVARNATYYRLAKSLTLARSTLFGVISPYAGSPGLPGIPLAERFFSGGSSSQRAFPDNQAGPRDLVTGFPIGGDALFMNSVELRFPLLGENIGGVLFNDMGNVYSSLSAISLRWRQESLKDFDYGVQSFGFGIRYHTPIGPVRLDLSLSPNSPRFFGFSGTYNQLVYGGGTAVVQRINIFQFHFSLGQAF